MFNQSTAVNRIKSDVRLQEALAVFDFDGYDFEQFTDPAELIEIFRDFGLDDDALAVIDSIILSTTPLPNAAEANDPMTTVSADEADRISRQIGTFGAAASVALKSLRVLVIGLDGCACEAAKNLILMGLASVELVQVGCGNTGHLDRNNSVVCFVTKSLFHSHDHLGAPYPTLEMLKSELSVLGGGGTQIRTSSCGAETLAGVVAGRLESMDVDCVVVATATIGAAVIDSINAACRRRRVPFIVGWQIGICGGVISDFGDSFVVRDPSDPPQQNVITSVEWTRDGDAVIQFEPLKSDTATMSVKKSGTLSFKQHSALAYTIVSDRTICVAKPPHDVCKVGEIFQHDVAVKISNRPVLAQLIQPQRGERGGNLEALATVGHVLMQGDSSLHERFRGLGWVARLDGVNLFAVAWQHLRLQPLAATIGGLVAQEVVKVTGRYIPFLEPFSIKATISSHLLRRPDSFSAIQAPKSPSDHLTMMFGEGIPQRLGALKVFLVGVGAVGCEELKNIAMMGWCRQSCGGWVATTDGDHIEVSNLSRQFFFRREHVGSAKSVVAAASVVKMEPDVDCRPLTSLVGRLLREPFHEPFWEQLDMVFAAVDSFKVRHILDEHCFAFGLPMLECGTNGVKGSLTTVVPGVTRSYTDSVAGILEPKVAIKIKDATQTSLPICTIRLFPSAPTHCLPWVTALFTDLFQYTPTEPIESARVDPLSREVFEVCASIPFHEALPLAIDFARRHFFKVFRDDIHSIIAAFPRDHLVDGAPMWGTVRRFPSALMSDQTTSSTAVIQLAEEYIVATTLLTLAVTRHADSYGDLFASQLADDVRAAVTSAIENRDLDPPITAQPLQPVKGMPPTASSQLTATSDRNAWIPHTLRQMRKEQVSLRSIRFDKDCKLHVTFATTACALRCRNYSLSPLLTSTDIQVSVGRMIPAVATTTSVVCGLTCIEALKVALRDNNPMAMSFDDSAGTFYTLSSGTSSSFAAALASPLRLEDKARFIPSSPSLTSNDHLTLEVSASNELSIDSVICQVTAFCKANMQLTADELELALEAHSISIIREPMEKDVVLWTKYHREESKTRDVIALLREHGEDIDERRRVGYRSLGMNMRLGSRTVLLPKFLVRLH